MKPLATAYSQRLLRGQTPSYERLQARFAEDGSELSDADKAKDLLLCFMSDPYQSEAAAILTRKALTILEGQGFKAVNVLTKAGSMYNTPQKLDRAIRCM